MKIKVTPYELDSIIRKHLNIEGRENIELYIESPFRSEAGSQPEDILLSSIAFEQNSKSELTTPF